MELQWVHHIISATLLPQGEESLFTDAGVCTVVSFMYFHPALLWPLLPLKTASTSFSFFSPHKYDANTSGWLGLALWQVQLGAGWHWLCQSWGKFLAAFHSSHSCSPTTTSTTQAWYHKKRAIWKVWGKGRAAGSEGIRACAVVTTPLVYFSLPSNGGGKIRRNPSGYHLKPIIFKVKLRNEYPESFHYFTYFL